MGFLNNKDSFIDEAESREEEYLKMFPKIGRDFVYSEDLRYILWAIEDAFKEIGIEIQLKLNNDLAITQAREYASVLESGTVGQRKYQDLIDLED